MEANWFVYCLHCWWTTEPHWPRDATELSLESLEVIDDYQTISLLSWPTPVFNLTCLPYYCSSGNCLILSWIQHDNKGKILVIHEKKSSEYSVRIPFIAIFLRNTIFDGSWHKCAIVESGVSQYSVSLSLPAAVALWLGCVNHTLDTSLWWGELIELICEGGEEGDE